MASSVLPSIALLLFVSSALAFYGKGSNVVELTTDNFAKEVFGSNDVWLVEFYAPWCGHCKNLAPQWESAATKLKGLVKIGAINCDVEANKQLAAYYQVQGFPTIKVFSGDFTENPHQKGTPFKTPSDYQGQRTADAIVAHAMTVLKYYGDDVNEANLDNFLGRDGSKVLLFSEKPKTTSLYKALSGHFNGRLHFGQAQKSNTAVVERFGVAKFPTLLVVNPEGNTEVYTGGLNPVEIQSFLGKFAATKAKSSSSSSQQSPPPPPPPAEPVVHHIDSQASFDENCPSGICAIALLNPEDESHQSYLNALQKMSEEYLKYFRFMWVDGIKFHKFCADFGKGEDLPSMVVLSPTKKVFTPFVGAFNEESMRNFLGKVLHGKKRSSSIDRIPPIA